MGTNSGATGKKEGWFGNGGGDTLYHNIGSLKDLFIQHWQGHLVHSPSCIVGLLFLIGFFLFHFHNALDEFIYQKIPFNCGYTQGTHIHMMYLV